MEIPTYRQPIVSQGNSELLPVGFQELPIMLIVCANTLHNDVAQRTAASRSPGSFSFPSYLWAADCTIISKEGLDDILDTSLNPVVALELFLIHCALLVGNCPFADD